MTVPANRKFLLGILMAIYVANHLDRVALGLLMEEIKLDLRLTDTQLGLLPGLAFALFYAVMGLPIARWADRGNRVTIISITAGLWSTAVVMCGAASNFVQLLLARVCVGIGEAGCVPPAHSLIADYFSRAERPRATSLYTLSGSIAFIIGYFATGWLSQALDWRLVFAIVGLPGIALAVVAWFFLKEPRLAQPRKAAEPREPVPSIGEVIITLGRIPAFRHLLICFSIWYFFGYGLMQWQPTFFIRSHGLDTGVIGTAFALIIGVTGVIGTLIGGELATRFAAGNERRQLHFGACAFIIFAVFTGCAFVAPTAGLAFAALAVANLGGNLAHGPMLSTIQTLVPSRMRAVSMAIIYLFANMIGLGLGPLAAGMLSDGLAPIFGAESLRYALLALCPGYFWAAFHLWLASRKVDHDIAQAMTLSDARDNRPEPA